MADETIYIGADDSATGNGKIIYTGTLRLQKTLYDEFEEYADELIKKRFEGKDFNNPPNLHFNELSSSDDNKADLSNKLIDFIMNKENGWKLQIIKRETKKIDKDELLCKNISGAVGLYRRFVKDLNKMKIYICLDNVSQQTDFMEKLWKTMERNKAIKQGLQKENIFLLENNLLHYIADNIISSTRAVLTNNDKTNNSYKAKKIIVEKIIEKFKCHNKNKPCSKNRKALFTPYTEDENGFFNFENGKCCDILKNSEFCDKDCRKLNN